MIRIKLDSEGPLPPSLIRLLEASGEVQIQKDGALPDVFLFCTSAWNREALARIHPPWPTLILCRRAEEPFATDSILKKEVCGVLIETATSDQIVTAIRAASAGLRVLQNAPGVAFHSEAAMLTARELQVLRLIADGEGNKSIAYLLGISEHTVKFHISSIFQKLRVSSRTEAIKAGITGGLISI
jgi:DNA-binding NarL/FixJ family response regulator